MTTQQTEQPASQTRDRAFPLICLGIFIVTQLLLPAALLLGPRGLPFGWQMFAATSEPPTITALLRDGGERPFDLYAAVAVIRGDFQITPAVVRSICDRLGDARALRISRANATTAEEVACP
jgi:hypothetical protein